MHRAIGLRIAGCRNSSLLEALGIVEPQAPVALDVFGLPSRHRNVKGEYRTDVWRRINADVAPLKMRQLLAEIEA